VVWWPLSATSWRLQATTNLTAGSIWTDYPCQTNGAICYRHESQPSGNKFYRLLRGP